MRSGIPLLATVLVASAVTTSTASASNVRVEDGLPVFRSGQAASDVKIDFGTVNGTLGSFFSDALQPLKVGPGCAPLASASVQCPGDTVRVRLGDGNDRVDALRYRATGSVGVWADGGDDDIRLNTLSGGPGSPVNGGDGEDTIQVNTSSPNVRGGAGHDHLNVIGTGRAVVEGNWGDDLILNTNSNALVDGGSGADGLILRGFGVAYGDAGRDVMILTDGWFTADGGAGADTIVGGGNRLDTISGGDGDDVVDVTNGSTGDTVDCGGGHDTVYADPWDIVTNCEHVQAGPMPPNPDVAAVYAHAREAFGVTLG
jgi:Ca2+-binding RTX toxin-like protein